jgi:hypothetical protein
MLNARPGPITVEWRVNETITRYPSTGWVLGESIFRALCVFFIALALRNYFKLR